MALTLLHFQCRPLYLRRGPFFVQVSGSITVLAAGDFYKESALAAQKLGIRAILLAGSDARNQPKQTDPCIFVGDYAPYSQLFPRAAAVVHQGGAGTTAQVLLAGVPSLFVPYSHDQPDNARRITALGAARTVQRNKYRAEGVAAELNELLSSQTVKQTCARLAAQLAKEDGVRAACEGLERLALTARASGHQPCSIEPRA